MSKMKHYLVFFFIFSFSFSQTGSIGGVITDRGNQESIPMVNVSLKKQNKLVNFGNEAGSVSNKVFLQGTSSDIDGNYIIKNIEPGTYLLEFSFIGYATEKREVTLEKNETKSLNVSLSEESNLLGDVVISAGKF